MLSNSTFDYAALGLRVRDLRVKAHLTQEALAEAANISVSFIGHIERGEKKFSVRTLHSLVKALGTSADYLMDGRLPLASNDTSLKEAIQAVLDSYQ